MKKLKFIIVVAVACIITFACQPPKQGGFDAPSRTNPSGTVEDNLHLQGDTTNAKPNINKAGQDSTQAK